MINLSAFLDSLKLTWFRRLLKDDGTWKLLIKNKFDFNKIITCGEMFCENVMNSLSNKFWKDVINSYIKLLKKYKPKGDFDFLSSPLLFNYNIKIGATPIVLHSWHKKGLFI